MSGRIFLSCGQNAREIGVAEKLVAMLEGPALGFSVFVARSTNNFSSLNHSVLSELGRCDYVLFVNFRRDPPGFPGSLYSHQELAMALALGYSNFLIFQEEGAPNDGIIKSMVHNRPQFRSDEELLTQVREDVLGAQWTKAYSRFLGVKRAITRPSVQFSDGAGNILKGVPVDIEIENLSNDLIEATLSIEKLDAQDIDYLFQCPLKVSGQRKYAAVILPKSTVMFNVLMEGNCQSQGESRLGAFLISTLDLTPLPPLFADEGQHDITLRLDARAQPTKRFTLRREAGKARNYSVLAEPE